MNILKLIDVLEIHVHFKMIILKQEQMFLNYTFKLKWWNIEAVGQRCSVKKVFLEISQNWQENSCTRFSFLIKLQACLAQVFSHEFCEISKNTFSQRTPSVAAYEIAIDYSKKLQNLLLSSFSKRQKYI